ncbi:unnamed protein product [Rodentolepis nana]|uniref:Uncharacterized protein n=1 Tax=Rodentolepis nana TaxID=102285 RepID=A0A3P7RXQ4_RODNA|nr:unnamed protein product [Rodentolepis nana]
MNKFHPFINTFDILFAILVFNFLFSVSESVRMIKSKIIQESKIILSLLFIKMRCEISVALAEIVFVNNPFSRIRSF